MNRVGLGSVVTLALLLPVTWIASPVSIVIPDVVTGGEPLVVGVPALIFVGVPVLFTLFMVIEATGHLRERKPPS